MKIPNNIDDMTTADKITACKVVLQAVIEGVPQALDVSHLIGPYLKAFDLAQLMEQDEGVAERVEYALKMFETEKELPLRHRETLLAAIFHTPKGEQKFLDMSAKERVEYSGPWLRSMVSVANDRHDIFGQRALAALYIATDAQERNTLIERVVTAMREMDAGAHVLNTFAAVVVNSGRAHALSALLTTDEKAELAKSVDIDAEVKH